MFGVVCCLLRVCALCDVGCLLCVAGCLLRGVCCMWVRSLMFAYWLLCVFVFHVGSCVAYGCLLLGVVCSLCMVALVSGVVCCLLRGADWLLLAVCRSLGVG